MVRFVVLAGLTKGKREGSIGVLPHSERSIQFRRVLKSHDVHVNWLEKTVDKVRGPDSKEERRGVLGCYKGIR